MRVRSKKEKQKRELDNRGLTLIEVLVVIALMAILSGMLVIGTSMLNGKEAQKCSAALESELNSVRITTMGTATATARIYKNASDGCYYIRVESTLNHKTKSEDKKIGNKKVTLYYTEGEPADTLGEVKPADVHELTELTGEGGEGIKISFNRSSGAMNCSYRAIYVEQGNRVAVLYLYPETGKIKLKQPGAAKKYRDKD